MPRYETIYVSLKKEKIIVIKVLDAAGDFGVPLTWVKSWL